MYLFIFESLGTSELILIGILALIVFGPRQLPTLAKKAGKIMAEFRGTANEFKQTWEKEVNFEEEAKSLSLSNIDEEVVSRNDGYTSPETKTVIPDAPAITPADPESFKHMIPASEVTETIEVPAEPIPVNDKKNWL